MKIMFMISHEPIECFTIDNNMVLTDLLRGLCETLGIQHKILVFTSIPKSSFNPLQIQDKIEHAMNPTSTSAHENDNHTISSQMQALEVNHYQRRMDCLKSHAVIIQMIKQALDKDGWPTVADAMKQLLTFSTQETEDIRTSS